jgi:ribosomal protein S18 acetylase RimI-like enzyme
MHPLDNPIWEALTTRQSHFAEGDRFARRFISEVSALGAISAPTLAGYESLAGLLSDDGVVAVLFDEVPQPPASLRQLDQFPLLQMVYETGHASGMTDTLSRPTVELIGLTEADVPEMCALAELTKPGPFSRRTRELGTYLGIRQNGKLVAMSGERMRLPGYTEVSAVCTHPDHTGRGYARVLMAAIMKGILERGERPILHVRAENVRAIELYQRIGFTVRRGFEMAVLRREQN